MLEEIATLDSSECELLINHVSRNKPKEFKTKFAARVYRRNRRHASNIRARETMYRYIKTGKCSKTKSKVSTSRQILTSESDEEKSDAERVNDNNIFDEHMEVRDNSDQSSSDFGIFTQGKSIEMDTADQRIQRDNERVCDLEGAKQAFRRMWDRAVFKMGIKSRILHDIWEVPRNFHRRLFVKIIRDHGPRKSGILIICKHGEHLHIIHDCTYTGSQCRCKVLKEISEIPFDGGERRRERPLSTLHSTSDSEQSEGQTSCRTGYGERVGRGGTPPEETPRCIRRLKRRGCVSVLYTSGHWLNTFLYCEKNKRRICEGIVGGQYWVHGGEIRSLQLQRLYKEAKAAMVDRRTLSVSDCPFFEGYCSGTGDSEIDGKNKTSSSRQSELQKGSIRKESKLEQLIKGIIITPIKNIIYTSYWTTSSYRTMDHNHVSLRTTIHNIQQEITEMSVLEIFLYTRKVNTNRLIYVSNFTEVDDYYLNIEQSVNVLEKLLLFQFQTLPRVQKFLKFLLEFLDKKTGKMNTLYVLSPPNAGKNFFFDCVIHAMINFGQIRNINKFSSFPFQEAVNKRVLLWNEPNFEPSAQETLKMILGGDQITVNVKYQPDASLRRTPVIILTNNSCLNDVAFKSRVQKYTWERASFLQYVKKKPIPIAFFYLLLRYKILHVESDILTPEEKDIID